MTGPPERSSPGALAGAAEAKSNHPHPELTEIPAEWQPERKRGPRLLKDIVAGLMADIERRVAA